MAYSKVHAQEPDADRLLSAGRRTTSSRGGNHDNSRLRRTHLDGDFTWFCRRAADGCARVELVRASTWDSARDPSNRHEHRWIYHSPDRNTVDRHLRLADGDDPRKSDHLVDTGSCNSVSRTISP